jgi:hypothetical protein
MILTEMTVKARVIQVKTYGRTGSNLITNYFATAGYENANSYEESRIIEIIASQRSLIIHDHTHDYLIPNIKGQSICLFVKRRNTSAQFLSMMVAKKVKFFHDMDTRLADNDSVKPAHVEPFVLDKKECLFEARLFTEWHHKTSITLANSKLPYMVVYYEDYINDIEYFSFLHEKVGFKMMEHPEKKNSIQAENVVINYEEVLRWLQEWNLSSGVY